MKPLRPIIASSFFFSVHVALLSYLNSTVLREHTSAIGMTVAYTVASALSLILLIGAGKVARNLGSSKFLLLVLGISATLLLLLGTVAKTQGFVSLFCVYFALNTVIWYAFDLVVEHYSREGETGNIRGLYLTINNASWVLAPMAASLIATTLGISATYIGAGLAVICALVLILTTTRVPANTHLPKISFTESFNALVAHPYARRIVTLYFVIQFFFAWMVLYLTPYLSGYGFSLGMIGIILSVMLLPFVLFQYKVGKIADHYHNENTLLRHGFFIAGTATLLLALPLPPTAVFFATILFLTRVGASIVEVAAESAFFKSVNEHDTALISTLRMTAPLAYIIAPITGSVVFLFAGMHTLFFILACLLFVAMFYTKRLRLL